MINALTEQLSAALAEFTSTTRLYELTIGEAGQKAGTLLVEAFAAEDAVDEVGARDVIALSTSAFLDPASLLGQPASLAVSLADGSRTGFAGEISEAAMLGSDGGFARYRLRISPWLWRLAQVRNSRVLSKQRTICGFTFASVKGLSVLAKSIPESSLRTRVDNERYDACPYKVQLTYKGLGIPLDFGRDVTLERVRSAANDGFVRMAFFRQSENGWVRLAEISKWSKAVSPCMRENVA